MTEVLTYEALKADRDALADRVNALAVENANQRDWMNKCSELWDAGCDLDNLFGLMPETPATSAALAAIEARGVEKAIELLLNKFSGTGHIGVPVMALESLAIELREAK
ncbi:hypothetical protein [Serratia proteamaculans]|uniref:Uncharacterized protein n=1 Tax=Serratia proteamaculans TaxID=28151 RepID=A0A5Q2VH73_SERPR|nr:hypothetical protein [Serratia proteamaculans]QGH63390.1 hypothetical protein GHV41_22210 [Serratia proteamaculans]